jgi:hypothetical protein
MDTEPRVQETFKSVSQSNSSQEGGRICVTSAVCTKLQEKKGSCPEVNSLLLDIPCAYQSDVKLTAMCRNTTSVEEIAGDVAHPDRDQPTVQCSSFECSPPDGHSSLQVMDSMTRGSTFVAVAADCLVVQVDEPYMEISPLRTKKSPCSQLRERQNEVQHFFIKSQKFPEKDRQN